MSCGHLGCGKKNCDGSDGNNHAVGHSDQTGHPLVSKIESITPEGTACNLFRLTMSLAVYCYKCKEKVFDQDLASHLSVVGLDVASQKKTVQTM